MIAKPLLRWSAGAVALAAAVVMAGGIVLCESAVRVPHRIVPASPPVTGEWRSVEITARDGAVLRAWLLRPTEWNGNVVMVLHGISDSRMGPMGLAKLFLAQGYEVLAPDSRGHGESGGELVTYGLCEADDVHRWVDWLIADGHPRKVFGMGESLGAAVLLQSLAVEPRFSAVVAECPFANFERVAVDRVAQRLPVGPAIGHGLATPLVWSAFLYARVRYGLDYRAVSPEDAIGGISTPVLLIHGLEDTNVYPAHSRA
ncbi:MAG TPA: alpha/beta fold hydrolase, partial [Bryobacteraceae bacterium]|nr:alpha/beta fold hydrolase [Bryobacteraceae bacterium]